MKIGFDISPIYAGKPNKKTIYLLCTCTHFNVIKSINRFNNRSYYCNFCHLAHAKNITSLHVMYLNVQGQSFSFKQELENYCISDVKLLKEGTMTFRKNILNLTENKIDPFHRCITIASVCHLVYRTSLMKRNTIGIKSILL